MNERPFPHGPLPQAPPSRRGFIAVGVLAAAAAGGGVWLATSAEDDGGRAATPSVSPELRAAAGAERELLATVDAALEHAHGAHRSALLTVRTDHAAHLKAIEGAIADALYPLPASPSAAPGSATGSSTAPPPAGKVRIAQVRAAEQRAAVVASARAAKLTGRSAVLLASIAACEATHAEFLVGSPP
jgi:hypothetical protein